MKPVQKDDARFLDLLQRWLSGAFRLPDERALKSLTEADEFRREAMEGYASLPETDHEKRLSILRDRLREQTKPNSTIIPLWPRLMAAAAIFAALVAAVWFLPQLIGPKNVQNPVAQDIKTEQNNSPAPLPSPVDAAPTAAANENLSDQSIVGAPTKKEKIVPVIPSVSRTIPSADDVQQNGNSVKEEAFAEPSSPVQKWSAVATEKAFTRTAPPETQTESRNAEPQKDVAEDMPSASEPGSISKAKTSAPTKPAKQHETDKVPDLSVYQDKSVKQSEPEGGWDNFREYLRLNARLTEEARNNNVTGTVRLQFSINPNGDAVSFIVLKSLGFGCDEEAIRLVKEIEWIAGKNNMVTVDIKFVR